MKFDVRGGFKIARKPNRHGIFDKEFWRQVSDSDEDLPGACGCYVFAVQNGNNIVAWYVGKTEKRTFESECFQATKVNYYNEVLVDHNGAPLLFQGYRICPRMERANSSDQPERFRFRRIEMSGLVVRRTLRANLRKVARFSGP